MLNNLLREKNKEELIQMIRQLQDKTCDGCEHDTKVFYQGKPCYTCERSGNVEDYYTKDKKCTR